MEKIRNEKLRDDEMMISFDVSAPFPSIPVDEAVIELKTHLDNIDLPKEKRKIYFIAAKLCMEHNYFQFRNKLYKVAEGSNKGQSIVTLNCFMSSKQIAQTKSIDSSISIDLVYYFE